MSETLTMANPIETEKIRTHHAKIVIECTTGKPYYSIEWYDPAKQEYFLGYSSYNIENVLGWLSECFEIVEATKTNEDRIVQCGKCANSDTISCSDGMVWCKTMCRYMKEDGFCSFGERKTDEG